VNKSKVNILLIWAFLVFIIHFMYLVEIDKLATSIPIVILFIIGLIYVRLVSESSRTILIYALVWSFYSSLCTITDWLYISSDPLHNFFLTPDSRRFAERILYLLANSNEVESISSINTISNFRSGNGFESISYYVGIFGKYFNADPVYTSKIFYVTLASLGVIYFYKILKFYKCSNSFKHALIYALLFYSSTYINTFLRDLLVYFLLISSIYYFLREEKNDWLRVILLSLLCFTVRPTHGIIPVIPLFIRFIFKNRLRLKSTIILLLLIITISSKKLFSIIELYKESIGFYLTYTSNRIGNSSGITSILYENLPFWAFYPIRSIQIFFNPFLFSPPFYNMDLRQYQYFSWILNLNNFYFSIFFLIFLNAISSRKFRNNLDNNLKLVLITSVFFSVLFGIFSIDNRRLIGFFTVIILTALIYLKSISIEYRKDLVQIAILISLIFSSIHLSYLLK
jgi:hypothetical protein